jgi:hypothetical protein
LKHNIFNRPAENYRTYYNFDVKDEKYYLQALRVPLLVWLSEVLRNLNK